MKEFWKSINIWENYGQEFSVLIVFWLTVYKTAAMCELKTQQNADRIGKNERMKTTGWAKKRLANTLLNTKKVHETIAFLLVTLPNIHHRFKKNFTHRLSNKPFLIRSLTTPQPHLKYIATLPCSFSLMACFADTNVSRGSVAAYARCRGIFDIHLTANLSRNPPVNFLKIG